MKLGKLTISILILVLCVIGLALATYSHSSAHYLKKADKFFNNGEYGKAADFYNKVKNPNATVLVKKEKAECKTNHFSEAMKTIQLIEIKSGDSMDDIFLENNIYYDEITCCYNLKMYEKVIRESKAYFETSNNKLLDTVVEEYVSSSYMALEKFDEDIQFINDCLEKYDDGEYNSHVIVLYNHLDACYYHKKDLDI